ncbi:bacillithiol biosynthesis deacetylase BshB1 [Desulfitispora alkaliphila]|uniref:bacillithiol biosynthesis deacetylase BshB1 n=1 Tax=Desulfitispora alkaliphila TaxID=622674 RepID=UPI003D24CADF
MEQVDILAIGAHPDDVEIGMGGTIAKHVELGYKVGLLDLTRGEMGTNGSIEIRSSEGKKAMEILGCVFRLNLELPDGGVVCTKENVLKLVRVLRFTKPTLVFAPYWEDKHPDHVACSKLLDEAVFISSLKKFLPDVPPHKPKTACYYLINPMVQPSFVVDVTEYYDTKVKAVLAHDSQFFTKGQSVSTELNFNDGYPEKLNIRDRYFGLQIHNTYGEGFITKETVPVNDLFNMWR